MTSSIFCCLISAKDRHDCKSLTTGSSISTSAMQKIVDDLKVNRHCDSTQAHYYGIWKNFNKFFIKLDVKPDNWEDRIVLYTAFLIQNNKRSATVKSYISVIKAVLYNGGIEINKDSTLLASLTCACKLKNDNITARLIIRKSLLGLLISKLEVKYVDQPYLNTMYRALFLTTYYGMLCIGEVTMSQHVVKAKDIYIGVNKPKIMIILHTSKMHNKGQHLQIVKMSASAQLDKLCPFKALIEFLAVRRKYKSDTEPFFVFRDRSPVTPDNYRRLLKHLFIMNSLDHTLYGVHRMRAGR